MPAPLIWAQLFCTTQQSGHPSCLYESTVVFCSWRQATIGQKLPFTEDYFWLASPVPPQYSITELTLWR